MNTLKPVSEVAKRMKMVIDHCDFDDQIPETIEMELTQDRTHTKEVLIERLREMQREAAKFVPKHAAKYDDCETEQEKRAWTRWYDLNEAIQLVENTLNRNDYKR